MTPLRCDIKPELEFRSVWFCYNEDRPVLRDMSFRIEAGETVAVVGLNGSGKSTIGLLATRLYEPNAGSILVGGQDIRQVGRRSLRATLTLVPQDPVLFDETIRENLLYGNPRATGKDLETVAALTQLDRVLQTLPRGLDEPLGPLGGRLSGGEKKRLGIGADSFATAKDSDCRRDHERSRWTCGRWIASGIGTLSPGSDAGGDFAPPGDNLVGGQNSGGRRGSDRRFREA